MPQEIIYTYSFEIYLNSKKDSTGIKEPEDGKKQM
jgi:hypothetical protein